MQARSVPRKYNQVHAARTDFRQTFVAIRRLENPVWKPGLMNEPHGGALYIAQVISINRVGISVLRSPHKRLSGLYTSSVQNAGVFNGEDRESFNAM